MHRPLAPHHRSPVTIRQAWALRWAEWLERTATEGPRPLRPLFEAELAFERWAGPLVGAVAVSLRSIVRSALPVAERAAVATGRLLSVAAAHAVRAIRRAVDAGHRFVVAADRLDRRLSTRLPPSLSHHTQHRLGESLLVAAILIGLLAVAAAGNLHPSTHRFVVDRLANGAPVRNEALAEREQPSKDTAETVSPQAAPVPPPAPPAPPAVPPPPAIPAQRGPVPVGKGMWIYVPEHVEGGNPEAIVARATATGLTHLYVRTATLKGGFVGADLLDRLLPKAHAAGLRVYAWDFPYLNDVAGDVNRALAAIQHRTPDGHRVDGYTADIELRSMGVNVSPETATAFGTTLRRVVGPNYPLIATVPRPSPALARYPFAEVVASFDAIAPMVYWMHRDPAADVIGAIQALAVYGKPIIPVGQAYDASREGGPPGVPHRDQLLNFMQAAEEHGAVGVSWWSWQHADQQAWDAVRDAPHFTLPAAPTTPNQWQIRAYQTLLSTLGFGTPITGVWDEATTAAVRAYQTAARLPVTGTIDAATRGILLSPFGPPIQPQP